MAIINSYPTVTPTGDDLIIGTDVSTDPNSTKTFTVDSVIKLATSTPAAGTTNTIPIFTSSVAVGDSTITFNPSGVGTFTTSSNFIVNGSSGISTTALLATGNTVFNGSVSAIGDASSDAFNILSTLTIGGPVKDSAGTLGTAGKALISDSSGNLVFQTVMDGWIITADNGTTANVTEGETVDIAGGTKITTAATIGQQVTVNHDSTTRSDTTSSASPAAGATFTCVDSITQDVTGHPTAVNVKTVTMPAPAFTSYSALLTQSSTNPPVANVILNTIPGTFTWSYVNPGEYRLTATGTPFTLNKTQVFINGGNTVAGGLPPRWEYVGNQIIKIKTPNASDVLTNGFLTNGSIEIRVYS